MRVLARDIDQDPRIALGRELDAAHAADRLRVGQTDISPRSSGIARAIDAIALHDIGAQLSLAHADVHDVRIGWRDRDRTDR